MQKYEIIREERKDLPEEACPVDLMSELYKSKAEDENVIFTLTSEAFRKMCAFPVKKEVTYFEPWVDNTQSVCVVWLHGVNPSEHYSPDDEWLATRTSDRGKTFFVEEAKTEEITYKLPTKGSKVVHYVIN
jgi:hypothetical protein